MIRKAKSTLQGVHEAMAWHRAHKPPAVGAPAPDFELCDAHGASPVRLSSFRGRRPVALVFGSFT